MVCWFTVQYQPLVTCLYWADLRKGEGQTGFSEGLQECTEGFPKGEADLHSICIRFFNFKKKWHAEPKLFFARQIFPTYDQAPEKLLAVLAVLGAAWQSRSHFN